MTTLMRYDPFREALRLRDAMEQLFAQSFVRPNGGIRGTEAKGVLIDVFETEHGYQVKVLLPGIKPEDIELSVQQNTLTIKGQFQSSVKPDRQVGSGSHENVRPFKIIAMEKQVQTSIMHQKRFGEGERLANKTS